MHESSELLSMKHLYLHLYFLLKLTNGCSELGVVSTLGNSYARIPFQSWIKCCNQFKQSFLGVFLHRIMTDIYDVSSRLEDHNKKVGLG